MRSVSSAACADREASGHAINVSCAVTTEKPTLVAPVSELRDADPSTNSS